MPITVVLIEDHVVVRQAVHDVLDKIPDIHVIAEAGDGMEGVNRVCELKPDVAVMDISLPVIDGVEATRLIAAKCPETRVLALTAHTSIGLLRHMLKAGALGYLQKHCTLLELEDAIRRVAAGKNALSPEAADLVVKGLLNRPGNHVTVLSPRERQVLQLMAEGRSTAAVAAALALSISTVETYRRKIREKLGIDTEAGLIRYALREGLTDLED